MKLFITQFIQSTIIPSLLCPKIFLNTSSTELHLYVSFVPAYACNGVTFTLNIFKYCILYGINVVESKTTQQIIT